MRKKPSPTPPPAPPHLRPITLQAHPSHPTTPHPPLLASFPSPPVPSPLLPSSTPSSSLLTPHPPLTVIAERACGIAAVRKTPSA